VRRQVAVIVAGGTPPRWRQGATSTIPIVFTTGGDPVELGLVSSLIDPGQSTGVTALNVEIGTKRLELLHELVQRRVSLRSLSTNQSQWDKLSREVQAAARILGLELHVLNAATERDFDLAFATLAQMQAEG